MANFITVIIIIIVIAQWDFLPISLPALGRGGVIWRCSHIIRIVRGWWGRGVVNLVQAALFGAVGEIGIVNQVNLVSACGFGLNHL